MVVPRPDRGDAVVMAFTRGQGTTAASDPGQREIKVHRGCEARKAFLRKWADVPVPSVHVPKHGQDDPGALFRLWLIGHLGGPQLVNLPTG